MWSVLLRALNGLMALLYIGIGVFLLFTKELENLPSRTQPFIGVILVLYGLFRLYRIFKLSDSNLNSTDDTQDEDE